MDGVQVQEELASSVSSSKTVVSEQREGLDDRLAEAMVEEIRQPVSASCSSGSSEVGRTVCQNIGNNATQWNHKTIYNTHPTHPLDTKQSFFYLKRSLCVHLPGNFHSLEKCGVAIFKPDNVWQTCHVRASACV